MRDPAYRSALVQAGLIAPGSYANGVPVWRERGLATARLLVGEFLDRIRAIAEAEAVEHPFLLPAAPYRRVFGRYANTYRTEMGGPAGSVVLRPDNMPANVDWLRAAPRGRVVVALGGLLRSLPGNGAPLFRDRYMWPAVQATQLVPRAGSATALNKLQRAVEGCFTALQLPVVSVRTTALSSYGRLCYLTVSVLPDGAPTILSTSYVMADPYRQALGTDLDVLDVGFTGKAIAVAAMHHRDDRGLQLPSAVAPTQVGVLVGDAGHDADSAAWLARQRAAGVRVAHAMPGPAAFRRARAERRFHATGVPLVVGLGPRSRMTARQPLTRHDAGSWPATARLRAELAAYDDRLMRRAQARFDRGLRQSRLLRHLCPGCAERHTEPVFGWVVPEHPGPCRHCGHAGQAALISPSGRFY